MEDTLPPQVLHNETRKFFIHHSLQMFGRYTRQVQRHLHQAQSIPIKFQPSLLTIPPYQLYNVNTINPSYSTTDRGDRPLNTTPLTLYIPPLEIFGLVAQACREGIKWRAGDPTARGAPLQDSSFFSVESHCDAIPPRYSSTSIIKHYQSGK
jgi:hypothetical protein